MKTLTDIGINKQLVRMKDSLSHATFFEDGVLKRVQIFQATVTDNKIRIFVYLDDTVTGKVSDVALVDEDGDTIAVAKREFTKPSNKGIYSVFAYTFVEVEDPNSSILSGGGR